MASSARIDELLKKFDENPRRYFAPLANEYRKAGDLDRAIAICQEYLPQQPGHMSGHIVYGQALFELGRFEDARGVFETALALDPENLIALRHLGDVARNNGDIDGARGWYQRVLEADPRNEEIAELLTSLAQAAPADVAAASLAPTPLATPVVPESQPSASASPAPEPVAAPEAPSPGSAVPAAPPAPQGFVSPHRPKEEDLFDLDSFDIGGVSLGALRSAPEPEPAPPAASQPTASSAEDLAASGDDTFDAEAFGLSARPASAADVGIEKSEEFSATFESSAPAAEAPQVPPTPEAPATASVAGSFDGLETFEAGVLSGATDAAPNEQLITTEDIFEFAVTTAPDSVDEPAAPAPDAELANVPQDGNASEPPVVDAHASDADSDAEAAPFVTETMAGLYLQQGHFDSALEIYRQLVEQNPGDMALRQRLHVVEEQAWAQQRELAVASASEPEAAEAPAPAAVASAPQLSAGPTIREFLMSVFAGQPIDIDLPASSSAFDAADSRYVSGAHAEERADADLLARLTPSSSDTLSGSIGALFGGPASEPTNAADGSNALDVPAFSPTRGAPAHRAPDELSLNQVFREGKDRPSGARTFSFDQFFAETGAEPTTDVPEAASEPPASEGGDDIAQFNAWLNGLKQS